MKQRADHWLHVEMHDDWGSFSLSCMDGADPEAHVCLTERECTCECEMCTADRLLGRLIALDPDTAMRQLEAAKAHLDERMVRSAVPFVGSGFSEVTTDDRAAGATPNTRPEEV